MKKIWIAIACMITGTLASAPVGNTASPQILQKGFFIPDECWVNLRLGYEGDFVFDARLNQKQEGSGPVDKYSQTTNSGTVTLNVLERLDLYGVFGSSRACAQWRFKNLLGNVQNAEMETMHAFLWGFGARAILLEWGNWDLGVGGRYSAANNPLSWLTIDGSNAEAAGAHSRWTQWQVNCDISYHIDIFIPYIGIKYAIEKAVLDTISTPIANSGSVIDHFKTKCPIGLDLGCALSTSKYFMVNVEARLINEEALTISGDLRF